MHSTTCDLCDSQHSFPVYDTNDYITGKPQQVVRCANCSLVYVNPQPDPSELGDYYPEVYYGDTPFLYEKLDANSRFNNVKGFVQKGNIILDIGCGRGLVLSRLKEIGCEVWGTELSAVSSKYARESLGLDIINKNLEDCAFPDNHFDVVTMFHSLEHHVSPTKTLTEVYRILKTGGILIVEVPRFDSVYSTIFGDKWFHLDVPRHLFHFNENTLEKLFTKAKFRVIKKKQFDIMYDSFGALQSILNFLCSKPNLLNDINTKRTSFKSILISKQYKILIEALLSFILQIILYLPLILVSILLAQMNKGGTLKFFATKRNNHE